MGEYFKLSEAFGLLIVTFFFLSGMFYIRDLFPAEKAPLYCLLLSLLVNYPYCSTTQSTRLSQVKSLVLI